MYNQFFTIKPRKKNGGSKVVRLIVHLGIKSTGKLVAQRFVYARRLPQCLSCQKSKISRHISSRAFAVSSAKFEHVHLDIIVMPVSEGKRYCLMCIDHFTRWSEAFLMENQKAETVTTAL